MYVLCNTITYTKYEHKVDLSILVWVDDEWLSW
jgi:ABC-type tungstate transport system permease subunit